MCKCFATNWRSSITGMRMWRLSPKSVPGQCQPDGHLGLKIETTRNSSMLAVVEPRRVMASTDSERMGLHVVCMCACAVRPSLRICAQHGGGGANRAPRMAATCQWAEKALP